MSRVSEEIRSWLENHTARMERVKQIRAVLPTLLPPQSLMSIFPDVVTINDAELNPRKVLEFVEGGKGVSDIMNGERPALGGPFEPFDTRELRAAFSLQQPSPPDSVAKTMNGSFHSASRKRRNGLTENLLLESKRYRASPTSMLSPPPRLPRSASPMPTEGRNSSPSPPPLPAPRAVSPSTASPATASLPTVPANGSPVPPSPSLPPLPPGPPPARKMSATSGLIREMSFDSLEDDGDESVYDGELQAQEGQAEKTPPALQKQLLETIESLINIKTWPKTVRKVIEAFKGSGCPCGNPFAVRLDHEHVSPLVPEMFFHVTKNPLDLQTIYERVRSGSYYLWFSHFDADVRLVASNAVAFYTGTNYTIMQTMAKHFAECVENRLNAAYTALSTLDGVSSA